MARAFDWQSKGHRFESGILHFKFFMSKISNIISQLNEEDFTNIYNNIISIKADKSAYLLKYLKDKKLTDTEIREKLELNSNAYYTLRSRLNEKIEEYIIAKSESPRTDLLKKVANINEMMFKGTKAMNIATLKKLEKDLIDFELYHELTVVYKCLKKLHISSEEYYQYSQLYNQHVTYTLALDNAELTVAEYYKRFALFYINPQEEDKIALDHIVEQLRSLNKKHSSNRFYVTFQLVNLLHTIHFKKLDSQLEQDFVQEFNKVQDILSEFHLDSTYFNLSVAFDFIELYYLAKSNNPALEEKIQNFENQISIFLNNYSAYSFPALLIEIVMISKSNISQQTFGDAINKINDYSPEQNDVIAHIIKSYNLIITAIKEGNYEEGLSVSNFILNNFKLKPYPKAHLEIKCTLATLYALNGEEGLFYQMLTSIQRQIRIIGKEQCVQHTLLLKLLSSKFNDKKDDKILALIDKLEKENTDDAYSFSLLSKLTPNELKSLII